MNKEIERIKYFIPKNYDGRPYGKMIVTAEEAFILKSEKGINTPPENIKDPYYYRQLLEGKSWQGIIVHELWEQGILDGSVPYWCLLGGENPKKIMPRNIVDFMKKEIFKGYDKDLIEKVYQEVLNYWTRKENYYLS